MWEPFLSMMVVKPGGDLSCVQIVQCQGIGEFVHHQQIDVQEADPSLDLFPARDAKRSVLLGVITFPWVATPKMLSEYAKSGERLPLPAIRFGWIFLDKLGDGASAVMAKRADLLPHGGRILSFLLSCIDDDLGIPCSLHVSSPFNCSIAIRWFAT